MRTVCLVGWKRNPLFLVRLDIVNNFLGKFPFFSKGGIVTFTNCDNALIYFYSRVRSSRYLSMKNFINSCGLTTLNSFLFLTC